ncbi:TlpA family protein disulfide reductase [Corynebacterium sp. ACRQM]|uniref:TlpA family protein disulfide reductase n=1 Tax=Corynebacterium TaxID=1716 RepID=UPI001EF74F1D|nr:MULTISPECIES: TlpA disulfide reductase family protein [Corynebacterium]MCG7242863.1 TlpA family protein disulfide reductase [Corynebacterium sp. ACRPS]MCG7271419.1 TlpA family protein disulfide reductase [Corynebacterium sp. ACRQM]MCG7233174.1 TlpA family protein disulfide reductase [Corynebacterium sp. ACRPR]MDK8815534.1 TlpA disulfide reductase family protein [Corynebacterium sp. MSK073]WKS59672.1 TlpA family protein disulfide reductase [Corynebacterium accolens]
MKKYVFGTVIAAIVIAALVVVGVMQLRGDDNSTGDSAQAPGAGSESGSAGDQDVAERPDCPAGPIAGVDLECLGGDDAREGDKADEGITIANVWAWWCEPCRAELPHLDEVAKSHPDWKVVGVHADKNAANGAAFLNDVGVDLPSFQDPDNSFAGTLGLPGVVPVTVILRDGEVVKQAAQPFTSAAEIEKTVEEALAG